MIVTEGDGIVVGGSRTVTAGYGIVIGLLQGVMGGCGGFLDRCRDSFICTISSYVGGLLLIVVIGLL